MGKFSTHKWWLLTALLTVPIVAVAEDVPFFFAPGTPILSSRVNANFINLGDRLTALEQGTNGSLNVGFAKISGTTVNYFGGVSTTGVTSVLTSGTYLTVTFNGTYFNPQNEIVPQVTAQGDNGVFAVANARFVGFGLNSLIVEVRIFNSGNQTLTPTVPFYISLFQKPRPL